MKRNLISLAAGLLALASMAAPASAFCRPYIGAYVGGAFTDVQSALVGLQDGGSDLAGELSGELGCKAVIGGKGSKWRATAAVNGSMRKHSDGSSVFPMFHGGEASHTAGVHVAPGFMLTPNLEVYVPLGYGWAWRENIQAGGFAWNMPSTAGPTAGLGFLWNLWGNLNLDLRYTARFDKSELLEIAPGVPMDLKNTEHTLKAGLVMKF